MSNKESKAVWVVSVVRGARFDKRRNKEVPLVDELHVIGTSAACAVARAITNTLAQTTGTRVASEAVQMKRAGHLL